jgi:benzodiazapine receptor
MDSWYKNLKKSHLTPPAWIFGPVWFILYILMAVSFFIYLNSNFTYTGIILFITQFILNILWSQLFFKNRLLCISAVNNFVMNILVLFTIIEFRKSSYLAANLLIPYLVWILFALYLNLYICFMN